MSSSGPGGGTPLRAVDRVTGPPGRPVVVRTPAKVNLGLAVSGTRPDGYHEIRTVLASVDLWDTLSFTPEGQGARLDCDEPGIPTDGRNLVLRAFSLLDEATPGGLPGVRVQLRKRIPAGRGLGGGSADAAAALIGLNRCFELGFGRSRLHRLAARIGMDVPFFLYGGFALAVGRGDRIFPLAAAPELPLVLLVPELEIPTRDAYRSLPAPPAQPPDDRGPDAIGKLLRLIGRVSRDPRVARVAMTRRLAPETLAGCFSNDLEHSGALRKVRPPDAIPEMRRAVMAVGAVGTAMSGSGSAVFGVFCDRAAAQEAARRLSGADFRAVVTRTISREEHRAALFGGRSDGAWPRG